jgi:hypothetical protein
MVRRKITRKRKKMKMKPKIKTKLREDLPTRYQFERDLILAGMNIFLGLMVVILMSQQIFQNSDSLPATLTGLVAIIGAILIMCILFKWFFRWNNKTKN